MYIIIIITECSIHAVCSPFRFPDLLTCIIRHEGLCVFLKSRKAYQQTITQYVCERQTSKHILLKGLNADCMLCVHVAGFLNYFGV